MLTKRSKDVGMENSTMISRGESGEAKDEMQKNGSDESLVVKDNSSSPDDPKVVSCLHFEHFFYFLL
jgi:hypothetical protein